MTLYTLARRWAGLLNPAHRNTFDNTRIMGYFSVGAGACRACGAARAARAGMSPFVTVS